MSQCDCSFNDADAYAAEFTVVKWKRARKQYKCYECCQPIKVGELHEHVTGKWDGNFDTFRTCKPCVSVRESFCPNGWVYGGLAETLQQCLGFDHLTVPGDEDEEEEVGDG